MSSYVEARDVAGAVAAMASGARPIAGGTDLVVGARHGKAPLPDSLVGIHRIVGLAEIAEADGVIRIGSLATHASILGSGVLRAAAPGLLDASSIVGSHATRANGTIGGNVMNASPAMDTGAPLLCHGAVAVLTGPSGTRRLGLDELWTGPGRTSASADELMEGLELPVPPAGSGSAYVRLQYRRQMEIAVVGAAAYVELDGDTITTARVAITALTPVICRVPAAEESLVGQRWDASAMPASGSSADVGQPAFISAAGGAAAAAATPISDVRASAAYRTAMAAVVARRAVTAALRRAAGKPVTIPASDWSEQR
ncbi:MAG: FAD binding domain-containing protein [Nocardioidaceae bacterium]|nr:FAD binding domain-containing protein [Nocardioidaceae bacterium]